MVFLLCSPASEASWSCLIINAACVHIVHLLAMVIMQVKRGLVLKIRNKKIAFCFIDPVHSVKCTELYLVSCKFPKVINYGDEMSSCDFCTSSGMMWMRQFSDRDVSLRHTCEQGDRLQGYGWLMHDGFTFGVQEVRDKDFTLTTEFVKRMGGDHGGDWTWRITAKQHVSTLCSL